MEIPQFNINKVEINEIPIWKTDVPILINISKPIVDIPGCVRVHRNNLTSLIDSDKDEYGTYTECGNFSIPSFEPLQYNPNEFVYTQSETPQNQEQEFIEPTAEDIKYKPKDKKVKKPNIVETGKFGEDGWSISIGNVEDGNTKD